MRKLLIIALMIPNLALANFTCKRGSGIIKTSKGFLYSSKCHIEVGKLVQTNTLREEEIKELRNTIKLKDLAITKQESRVDIWQTATFKLEDRYNKEAKFDKYENWLFFTLGIIVTGAAVYGAGQLQK